ncbi:unnamed protein product [Lactuca virosa]|uniref:Uncharacterized protein n=1 Tax=Lactuca virosa TaxID=75947 RepID=A0AAU9MVH2_9ASTR|nr:unnamed protein product [Lactuca virosa]
MFSKYGKTMPDKLTFKELWSMTEGNRVTSDIFGWIASKLEWGITYFLAKDDEGYLSKESMRGIFDGSLFEKLSKNNASNGKKIR